LSVCGDAITQDIVVFIDREMDPAVMKMSTHPRDAAIEVARPRHGIGVLECLISLGRLVGGAGAATNIKPEGFHLIEAGRY
jgi:hypothetical protein